MELKPVIVLSGQTAGLGVIRALGAKGVPMTVVYHDPREMGRASRYVNRQMRLPDPEAEETQFIDCLMDDRLFQAGEVLIPTSDATLAAASRHKDRLSQKFIVACPDWNITRQFLEKKLTAEIAQRVGISTPRTFLPTSLADIRNLEGTLQFPALAKPSQSHLYRKYFDRKMTMVNNMVELTAAYREAEAVGVELMVQEYIPGPDSQGANYNAYFVDGEPLVEFTAQKIRSSPPQMGSPSALISRPLPELMEQGRKILSSVGFTGFACSEYKRDARDGQYKLIEVNVRHNLSSLLAVACGQNFPWIDYQYYAAGVSPLPTYFQEGVYWVDISRDVRPWLPLVARGEYPLKDFITPYLRRHVYAIMSWQDFKPMLGKFGDSLTWMMRRPLEAAR